jgi:TonB family protein
MKSKNLCLSLIYIMSGLLSASAQEMHQTNHMPVYPGGNDALKKFIMENMKYPDKAIKDKISGCVELSFLLTKQGKISDIQVIRGLSPECDAEAVRVTSTITGFEPAIRSGKSIDMMVKMPVFFKYGKDVLMLAVKGKVYDKARNVPVDGALVIIKGTNIGTLTDENGNYSLEMPADKSLQIMATGYVPVTEYVNSHTIVNVDLKPEYFVIDFNE